jgi:hypothetical protein
VNYKQQPESIEFLPAERPAPVMEVGSAKAGSAIIEVLGQQFGREARTYIESYQMEQVTPERTLALERHLSQVADILNTLGKPWFLSGGLALELSHGEIQRDHQDIDVALYKSDGEALEMLVKTMGYAMRSHDGQVMRAEDLVAQNQPNAFMVAAEGSDRPAFEIIFLDKNEQGQVVFGADQVLSFPLDTYEQPAHYQSQEGKQIPLTPPEVQLLYKLYDGRLRDLLDIQKTLPTLSSDKRQRLGEYLQFLGVTFTLPDGEIITQPEELLSSGGSWESARNELLSGDAIEQQFAKQLHNYTEVAQKVYRFTQTCPSKEDFLHQVAQHFGASAGMIHAQLLNKMYNYTHQNSPASSDDFVSFFIELYDISSLLVERIEKTAIRNLSAKTMWTTTSRSKRY